MAEVYINLDGLKKVPDELEKVLESVKDNAATIKDNVVSIKEKFRSGSLRDLVERIPFLKK